MAPRRLRTLLATALLGLLLAPLPASAQAPAAQDDDLRVGFRWLPDAFAGSSTGTFVDLWNEGEVAHKVLVGTWVDASGFDATVSPSRVTVPPGAGVVLNVRVQVPEDAQGGTYLLHVAAQGRHGDPAEAESTVALHVYGMAPCCEPRPCCEPHPAPEPCCTYPAPEPCCQPPACCEPQRSPPMVLLRPGHAGVHGATSVEAHTPTGHLVAGGEAHARPWHLRPFGLFRLFGWA